VPNLSRCFSLLLICLLFILTSAVSVSAQQLNNPGGDIKAAELLKLQSYLQAARRSFEFNDFRSAFNFYKKIAETDWQYEQMLPELVQSGIRSGAVKETETLLLKLFLPYTGKAINSTGDPACTLTKALAVFYFSTGRAQNGEEYLKAFSRSSLSVREKASLSANVYSSSGQTDQAVAVLLEGRKNLKDPDGFSLELAQLYQQKKEYQPAATELIRYINSITDKKGALLLSEIDLPAVEAQLTGIVENASTDELAKITSDLEKWAAEKAYFYKLLSALYFNQKQYDRSFVYFKKAPALQTDGQNEYLSFARELTAENEPGFAQEYYRAFFAKQENITSNQPDFFNYLRLLIKNGARQEALTVLESPSLPALCNPIVLDLFKADIFFYDFKQPSVAAGLLEKYVNAGNISGLMAQKISRDLAIFQNNFNQARQLNNRLENSDLTRNNIRTRQEIRYTALLLERLTGDTANFTGKALDTVKKRSGSDMDNDLLLILNNLTTMNNNRDNQRIYLKYLAFTIHRQPVRELDSLTAAVQNERQSEIFQHVSYFYLKEINRQAAVNYLSRLVADQSRSTELPALIIDQAQEASSSIEITAAENNLLYLLKNYTKNIHEEPARKLLRKIRSKRAG